MTWQQRFTFLQHNPAPPSWSDAQTVRRQLRITGTSRIWFWRDANSENAVKDAIGSIMVRQTHLDQTPGPTNRVLPVLEYSTSHLERCPTHAHWRTPTKP